MAVVDDLQKVARLLAGERGKAPVVEDQQIGAWQVLEEPRIAAVTAGERQRIEQPGHAMIEDGAQALVAERASNPTFADAGWADDEQIACDPPAMSFWNSARSRPRGNLWSMSSTIAD